MDNNKLCVQGSETQSSELDGLLINFRNELICMQSVAGSIERSTAKIKEFRNPEVCEKSNSVDQPTCGIIEKFLALILEMQQCNSVLSRAANGLEKFVG
jgi:hypothetical protein